MVFISAILLQISQLTKESIIVVGSGTSSSTDTGKDQFASVYDHIHVYVCSHELKGVTLVEEPCKKKREEKDNEQLKHERERLKGETETS